MDKTLRLLHSSNPTLFEWSNSPIVYQTTPQFELLLPVIQQYFISRPALWHYLSMAQGNYPEYLKGSVVKAKKYFYVIRPILACRWILQQGTPSPMLFASLAGGVSETGGERFAAVENVHTGNWGNPKHSAAERIH